LEDNLGPREVIVSVYNFYMVNSLAEIGLKWENINLFVAITYFLHSFNEKLEIRYDRV
jgi:hypothetical protein